MISTFHNRMRQRKANITLLLVAIALLALPFFAAQSAHAQTYTVLHNFRGSALDGASPQGQLLVGSNQDFYGVTALGGTHGYGTVFQMTTAGQETVLHSFAYFNGYSPTGGLVQDAEGNLYGTTVGGGYGGGYNNGYWGTLFELTGSKETLLHQFGTGNDAWYPNGVIADAQGNFYGAANSGGVYGYGMIFQFMPHCLGATSSCENTLYNFTGGTDGGSPPGGLAWGADGKLYGVTQSGGATGYGTVFKVDTSGNLTTLYSFRGPSDGFYPNQGPLAFDTNGNIYGSTLYGGGSTACGSRGCGTVFRLSTSGVKTIRYAFEGGTSGGFPQAGVVLDAEGNLYGTASQFGDPTCSCGVLFEVSQSGQKSVLHTWTGSDGANPIAGLLISNGALYGVASAGGTSASGVLFELTLK